jgi:Tetratricopeptide Repeats-Sensor
MDGNKKDDPKKIAEELIKREEYVEALGVINKASGKYKGKKPNELKGSDRKDLLRLIQLEANAYARLGQLDGSEERLKGLIDQGFKDAETLGLYARTCKDRYFRSGDPADLTTSRDTYASSFSPEHQKANDAAYVGINAAAMSVLLNEPTMALDFGRKVKKTIGSPISDEYWLLATIAEAELIEALYTEDSEKRKVAFKRVAALYKMAVDGSPEERGSHGSTWLQARRLMRAMRISGEESELIGHAFRHLTDVAPSERVWEPQYRRLRVYAFDPNFARQMETAEVNELILQVTWEDLEGEKEKVSKPAERGDYLGPVGEYLEVVDVDPASGCAYEPINLNDPKLIAKDGKAPSVGDPQFHQQMVYAVGMNVIAHFERALGRRALWSSRISRDDEGNVDEEFVRRLRLYPHALREANAYYSPLKKALLFGYFPAEANDQLLIPGGTVFTCLSHDIIAHEMSHALMDGLHPRFAEPTNRDVLSFHEAFADIVALFQHFSHPEVLRYEVARTRGKFTVGTYLGQLAQEFGRAIGRRGALRDAIGEKDDDNQWQRKKPDPDALVAAHEPHDRGAILVVAVFDAFLSIYETRTKDLLRIATQGSGILKPGEIHPDLVERLAREAAKAAKHILHICIRALDYCPPVDITFGDYLRALITADVDAVPNDRYHYRLALIESFQRRGIYPEDVRNLSVESLVWRKPRESRYNLSDIFTNSSGMPVVTPEWRSTGTRFELWNKMRENAAAMHGWLMTRCPAEVADEIGLHLDSDAPRSFYFNGNRPTAEVHSVRVAQRTTQDGGVHTDLVVEIMQRRRGYFDSSRQKSVDGSSDILSEEHDGDFKFRGGCTLLIDPSSGRIRYAINKHILSDNRLGRQRAFLTDSDHGDRSLRATYFGDGMPGVPEKERFALLHQPGVL